MGVRFTLWAVDVERLLDVLTANERAGARESSLLLQRALRRASGSPSARHVVRLLGDGHRRWWVGSLLESLRRPSPWLLNQGDVAHAEEMLSRMLRGWNCGATVRDASPSATRSASPVTPASDADLRLAVLSPSDFEFLRLFLDERLRDDERRFVRPSGVVGVAPDRDDEWDAWVRQVLREITATPLDVPDPTLVSLLG